ncbi:aminoglycoside 3'-phosphotransferase/choline kinase family protein [Actinosynnema pretiosum subsp. pretiosum]|uniref:Aminoglycoside phosphotransferase n=2 Tax=Actinosynnema TaxID=40566 RepID=C6WH41_ACTMD|nr:aminoglycoside 3'-phosphotransferase/choline kinase family protein [Actinosynnema mirum]ACU36109.1 aminoglycoside phosphotransferase [Actinosynnema mirum DSM 43827]AXX29562.1 putative phosphotransferase [Actinosynnema pretiosum subsp. pretiosum]QUF06205.1 aminoglycoside 3'-phosphotransferase/choline kinase family protein [Actinosynnema pretiosum subsp. pretiosum]
MPLPVADTEARFEAITPEELLPGVAELARRLGLTAVPERFASGSLPVYSVGHDHVLKLFPALYLPEVAPERDVLAAVHGKLPAPTPELLGSGEFQGWGYVHMGRLHGDEVHLRWPRLGAAERVDLAHRVGECLAALHEVPSPVAEPADWAAFTARQRAGCVERQRARGLAERWVEQIPDFLDSVDLGAEPRVLAHTEVMGAHLLTSGGRLTGLFDFEPAMPAAREYEFVATGVFLTRGERAANRALHAGYGREVDPRRVMAYTLLHVYSNLPWYLKEVPSGATTFDELAQDWFGG